MVDDEFASLIVDQFDGRGLRRTGSSQNETDQVEEVSSREDVHSSSPCGRIWKLSNQNSWSFLPFWFV